MRCLLNCLGIAIQSQLATLVFGFAIFGPSLAVAQTYSSPSSYYYVQPTATHQTTYVSNVHPVVTPNSYSVSAKPPVPAPLPTTSVLELNSPSINVDRFAKLADILENAKSELAADQVPKLETANEELRSALSHLEAFIVMDSPNGQAWNRFLRLDELREQLASDRPSLSLLNELDMHMRQNYLGLEYPQFFALRVGLNNYINASRFGSKPERTVAFLSQKIDQTLKAISAEEANTPGKRYAVEEMLTYLAKTSQASNAVSRVKALYGTPNLSVSIQESMINRLLARTVAEPQKVNECILGTRVIGNACLSGSVTADVMPASNGVSIMLNLSAQVNTRSKGYNRGVVLNTTSYSPVFASKQLFASLDGVSSSPATATASLSSRINSIEHRLRIVRKIARKKAAEQKPQADAIARGRLQRKVQRNYDSQVDEQLSDANVQLASFKNRPMPELSRLGLVKPAIALSSSSDSVDANAVQATSSQLSAPSACPLPRSASASVVIQAHQSALVNTLDSILGGRTIRSQDLPKYAKQITGRIPEQMLEKKDEPEWSVTMKAFRPVQVDFDDQLITVTLKLADMRKGKQRLNDEATVKASFKPSFEDGVLTLERTKDLELSFKKAERGVLAVTFKAFFQNKFEEVFKERIVTQKLDLASRFPRLPAISIDDYQLDEGWLQITLR